MRLYAEPVTEAEAAEPLAEPTGGLLSLDSESTLTSDGLCQEVKDPVLHESMTQNCNNKTGEHDSEL